MPRMIKFSGRFRDDGGFRPVATEEELLEFANKVREAGGADVIDALLPSTPEDAHSCLIANALNFKCHVDGWSHPTITPSPKYKDGSSKWAMYFPENMSEADRRKIIDAVPGRAVKDTLTGHGICMLLPKHIGNAAEAFDHRIAFTDFIRRNVFNEEL